MNGTVENWIKDKRRDITKYYFKKLTKIHFHFFKYSSVILDVLAS